MNAINHKADFCVVGGGMSGLIAAIAAAREGASVVLMHDRPVLGGNASSEIRMWICGCRGLNNRETGILEEIIMEDIYRNPTKNIYIWDSVLYEKVRNEPSITLLLNCSCTDAEMDGNRINNITGWQLTTYTWHKVEAKYFADCSGDSILAPLTGAEYRVGREPAAEFNEPNGQKAADSHTMGMSCLLQGRETDYTVPFKKPSFARSYSEDELKTRDHDLYDVSTNYWWIELGGEQDSIADTEKVRDQLLEHTFGIWDHIKNSPGHNSENWDLDWLGWLPGKRESRRYVGDYILTQNDLAEGTYFEDAVAYGGWPMDDHPPQGIYYNGEPTTNYTCKYPYSIPYRVLYSKNIENLFFAGRNISTTHMALSSTRVMGTCALLGQAIGTAAAIANTYSLSPRGVYQSKMQLLQEKLLGNDMFIPGFYKKYSKLNLKAEIKGDIKQVENLFNGMLREYDNKSNYSELPLNSPLEMHFEKECHIGQISITFDSDLNRDSCGGHPHMKKYNLIVNKQKHMTLFTMPQTLAKEFMVSCLNSDGEWTEICRVTENRKRQVKIYAGIETKAIRLVVTKTWGFSTVRIFDICID